MNTTRDWSQEIKRDYVGGDVCFDFPRRQLGWARLVGLFLVGFGLFFMWMPGNTAWEFIQKLLKGNFDVGNVVFSLFPLLFVIAALMPMVIGLAILFGRCRLAWRDGQLHCMELVGPFRWTRRVPRKPIRKLEISVGTSQTGSAPPKSMENFSCLVALFEDGSCKILVFGYPKDWLLAVAEELKTYVGSGSASSAPLQVEVVESVAKAENDDEVQRPANSRVELEERGAGFRLAIPPAGLWKGSKGLFFFSLLWCGFMCVFTGISIHSLFTGSGGVPVAFWIFIPVFWLIGLSLMLGAVNMGRRSAELAVDSGRLRVETKGIFGVKVREWSRVELAAVRADASGMEVNDRPVIELQIHPVTGKKCGLLAGRDEQELRWMAAQLRRALKIPAR